MGLICFSGEKLLSVDDETKKKRKERVRGFSQSLFVKRREFEVLKNFCTKYGIKQADLVVVFTSYLSTHEAHLREFRVKILDLKVKFLKHSKLEQELADIFFPAIFMQDIQGLGDAYSTEEVSYTRFVITMFLFCSQQTPDLVLELFAILKKNFALKLEINIFLHNLCEMLILFTEDQNSCASKLIMRTILNEPKEKEISIGYIIKLGIKYPVLFYALEKFKKKCRRFVFGDKFWQTKKHLKLKTKNELNIQADVKAGFVDIAAATAFTASSIITDAILNENKFQGGRYQLSEELYTPQDVISYIGSEDAVILKSIFGYKDAKKLIVESGIPYSEELKFITGFETGDFEEKTDEEERELTRIIRLDKENDRNFLHDPASGETAWAQNLLNEDDTVFREIFRYDK